MAHELEIRARRAYERARLDLGLRAAIPVAILAGAGVAFHRGAAWCAIVGLVLCASVIAFVWRGGGWARSVGPAIALGLVPLTAPVVTRGLEPICVGGGCIEACLLACCAGGFCAGLLLAARYRPTSAEGWLSAATLLGLTGSIGCACAGAPGLVGMIIGGLAGAAPVGVWAYATAARD